MVSEQSVACRFDPLGFESPFDQVINSFEIFWILAAYVSMYTRPVPYAKVAESGVCLSPIANVQFTISC